jgi:hypothetical protein
MAVRVVGATSLRRGEQLPGALAEAGLLWMATVVALDTGPHAALSWRVWRC